MLKKIKSFLFENKTDKQTIIKNTFWLMLAEGISKWGMFFITILIARILWPEQFWILSFVMSFVAMFIVITDFGLTTLMVREVSRDHSKIKDYLVNLSFLKVALGLITFVLVLIISQFIWKDDFYITLILIYVWYAILNNFWEFIRAFFRPSEKMQYEALLKIINWVLMLVIVLSALFLYWDLESILYGYLIAWGLSLVISLVYVWRKFEIGKFRLDKEVIKSSLKSGVYLMGSLIFIQIFVNSDLFILWYFWFLKELWLYSASYKIIWILGIAISLFIKWSVIPNIIKKFTYNKYKKIIHIILFVSISYFIILLIFWKYVINFLYWVNFINSYNSLIILAFTFIIISTNIFFVNILVNYWYEKYILYFTIIAWTVNIFLNILTIPIYKEIWAWFSTMLSELILFILIFTKYKKSIKYDI